MTLTPKQKRDLMGSYVEVVGIYRRNDKRHTAWWEIVDEKISGWIVGFRTIQDIERDYDDDGGSWTSFRGKSHQAAMIAPSPYKNAVYVPIERLPFLSVSYSV